MGHSEQPSPNVAVDTTAILKERRRSTFYRFGLDLRHFVYKFTTRTSADMARELLDNGAKGDWGDPEFDRHYRLALKNQSFEALEIMVWAHYEGVHQRRPGTIQAQEDELASRLILGVTDESQAT